MSSQGSKQILFDSNGAGKRRDTESILKYVFNNSLVVIEYMNYDKHFLGYRRMVHRLQT